MSENVQVRENVIFKDTYRRNVSETVCGSRSKCKITGGFYHCEYLCEDVTEKCVSADSTTAASASTTESTTMAPTTAACTAAQAGDSCDPNDADACCPGLSCKAESLGVYKCEQ